MKKGIAYFLLTCVFIAVIYIALSFTLSKISYKNKPLTYITNNYYNWKGGDTYTKFREFDKEKNYDVIILGSSRAYRGYSPFLLEQMGYQAFNLGTSAQSVKNSYFVLKNYVNRKNCKLLILDVFAGCFAPNQLESSSDLIQNINDLKVASEISMSYPDVRTLNMLALRTFNENDAPYFSKNDYLGRGYSTNTMVISTSMAQQVEQKSEVKHAPFTIDEVQLSYFKKIVQFIKEEKLKALFVYSPVSYFYNPKAHELLLKEIKPVLAESSAPFLDYSQCDSINTLDHFYDESHLNHSGVEIFTRQLFSRLTKEKFLQAHD